MAFFNLILPEMGESITEATLSQWLVEVGDQIKSDQAVAEVATDKVDTEVPTDVSGIVIEKKFKENDVVKVGEVLAVIETDQPIDASTSNSTYIQKDDQKAKFEKTIKEPSQTEPTKQTIKEVTSYIPTNETETSSIKSDSDRFYSPLVKSIAKSEQVSQEELDQIKGTGKDNRVTKKDILEFLKNKTSLAPTNPNPQDTNPSLANHQQAHSTLKEGKVEMSRMEQLISDHMLHSLTTAAHVQSFIEVDVTTLWNWRENVKNDFLKREGEKLTFTPIFMLLVAQALRDFPLLNSSLEGTTIIKKKDINLGMATALPDGNLIVPVIKKADQLSLLGLVKTVNDLAIRSRHAQLRPDEIKEGTYTVTNVGMFDSLMGTPIINQPQVGILALGTIRKVPAVVETNEGDFIGIRKKMILSHSFDHRIINGAMGGLFIKKIKELIENWDINYQC